MDGVPLAFTETCPDRKFHVLLALQILSYACLQEEEEKIFSAVNDLKN